MKKLASARAALLAAPLGITAERLLTFAETGRVQSWRGDGTRLKAFTLVYTAHLIVTDYIGAPMDLLFVVLDWMHTECPDVDEEALRFHIDTLDHGTTKISLVLELSERIIAEKTPDGIRLKVMPDPDVLALDMAFRPV